MCDLIKRIYYTLFFYDPKTKEWIVYAVYKDQDLAQSESKKIEKQGFGQVSVLPTDFYMKVGKR